MTKEMNILIAGEAGQGTDYIGKHLGAFFSEQGLWAYVYRDYGSVIRGGHNFVVVKVSEEEVFATDNEIDILIALNSESLKHIKKLKKNGILICARECKLFKKVKTILLPFSEIENKFGKIFLNTACISALLTVLNYDIRDFLKLLPKRREENKKVAEFIVNYVRENYSKMIEAKKKKMAKKGELVSGNDAISFGMISAGLERYYAYPMTPATGILHTLAAKQKEFGFALQPENEIAVISMALGSAYSGKVSAVATSGGGFDLMHESLSFAGMAEIPILVIDSQRASSSTGLPTYSGQADMLSAIYAGHGEFPRIVAAPSCNEEAYEKSAELLKLAWKFQVPTILLSDKNLSEHYKTSRFKKIDKIKLNLAKGNRRYKITRTGISPLIIPGIKNSVVKVSSYEHDEYGFTTEDPCITSKMQEKRAKKIEAIIMEMKKLETVKTYGDKNSENIVIAWGSVVSQLRESLKYMNKKIKIIQPIYLEPFPIWEFDLKKAKNIILVEQNKNNQLAYLLKKEGIIVNKSILKYDGRPFFPKELAKQIENKMKISDSENNCKKRK
ncbi:MAG: 2-oxoacid:acceptor oxidoreductase subunit alpha [Candidatus Pacearchaeota archaeon]